MSTCGVCCRPSSYAVSIPSHAIFTCFSTNRIIGGDRGTCQDVRRTNKLLPWSQGLRLPPFCLCKVPGQTTLPSNSGGEYHSAMRYVPIHVQICVSTRVPDLALFPCRLLEPPPSSFGPFASMPDKRRTGRRPPSRLARTMPIRTRFKELGRWWRSSP